MEIVNDLIAWTTRTFEPLGVWGLFVLAFIESSFFPIPPDILLIVLTLAHPNLWLFYAFIAMTGSVFGAMFGYGLGYAGGRPVLAKIANEKKIEKVHVLFNKYEAWAIFIAGFTPIPYKVFAVSAGVFYIDFKKFVVASFMGRGLRFFLVSCIIYLWGESMVTFINDYFDILSIAGVSVGIVGYLVYRKVKYGSIRNKRKKETK